MKGLLIGGGILLSLLLGFVPGGIGTAKPLWWRWLAVVSMVAVFVLGLGIPTGGTFVDAGLVAKNRQGAAAPVRGTVVQIMSGEFTLKDYVGRTENVYIAAPEDVKSNGLPVSEPSINPGSELKVGQEVIVEVLFSTTTMRFMARRVLSHNPIASLPLIPALEERARNLYLHVPTAWLAQIAWFVACFYAVMYLRRRRPEDDIRATAAAGIGALFCILATVTGAIWAKFNWGVFWNWDPRQTSIFVVLIIYGAFFSLRSAIESQDQRARVSAIYLALLTVPVLFFMFVMPRLLEGLHPGSAGDVNAGPILSPQADAIDVLKQTVFAVAMFAFTMLYFWMLNIRIRIGLLELRRQPQQLTGTEGN